MRAYVRTCVPVMNIYCTHIHTHMYILNDDGCASYRNRFHIQKGPEFEFNQLLLVYLAVLDQLHFCNQVCVCVCPQFPYNLVLYSLGAQIHWVSHSIVSHQCYTSVPQDIRTCYVHVEAAGGTDTVYFVQSALCRAPHNEGEGLCLYNHVCIFICMYVRMYVEEEVSLSKCLLKIVYFVCIVCMFCLCSRSYRH